MNPISVFVKASECPACGHVCNMARGFNTAKPPRPGCLSVCVRCAAINEYGPDMQLRLVPDAKCSIPEMADARAAQRAIRKFRGLPIREEGAVAATIGWPHDGDGREVPA